MNRDSLLRILLVVLLGAGGVWLLSNTEWADTEVTKPAQGDAAKNRHYATQSLLRTLGAKVVRSADLDRMPPPQARLVLMSRHWDLFPDRGPRLRKWVEQGGHLVINANLSDHKELRWLPVKGAEATEDKRKEKARRRVGGCRDITEPEPAPPTYADKRTVKLCAVESHKVHEPAGGQLPSWALRSDLGTEMIRMPVGRGSVTVLGPWNLMENNTVLRGENPLVVAAALQVRRGAEYWFVVEEARDPLLKWLWQQGWPAIVLGLLALAVFLWRGAVRFGPMAAPGDHNRRSMTEQIAGTAHFLQRHGPDSLHAAQARALHGTASRHVRHYTQQDPSQRTAAIAKATGVDAQVLARALASTPRTPGELAADLEVIETARRLLDKDATQPRRRFFSRN